MEKVRIFVKRREREEVRGRGERKGGKAEGKR